MTKTKDDQRNAADGFYAQISFGATLVLPIAVKVYWQGATSVLPNCAGTVDNVVSDLYSKRRPPKNYKQIATSGQVPAIILPSVSKALPRKGLLRK